MGFPGGSLGREGGRGGGGGGVGLTDEGVAGRTGEDDPTEENKKTQGLHHNHRNTPLQSGKCKCVIDRVGGFNHKKYRH